MRLIPALDGDIIPRRSSISRRYGKERLRKVVGFSMRGADLGARSTQFFFGFFRFPCPSLRPCSTQIRRQLSFLDLLLIFHGFPNVFSMFLSLLADLQQA